MEPQLGVTESNLFSSAKERQGSGAGRGCAIVSAAFQRLKYRLVLVRACPILRDAHELEFHRRNDWITVVSVYSREGGDSIVEK